MAEGGFSVYVWTSDGKYRAVMRFVDAETAVNEAARLAKSVTAQEGIYTRVMITDGGDLCCFDWRHGEGVVFPTRDTEPNRNYTEEDRPRGEKYSET